MLTVDDNTITGMIIIVLWTHPFHDIPVDMSNVKSWKSWIIFVVCYYLCTFFCKTAYQVFVVNTLTMFHLKYTLTIKYVFPVPVDPERYN